MCRGAWHCGPSISGNTVPLNVIIGRHLSTQKLVRSLGLS
jgi:hypothetical protein